MKRAVKSAPVAKSDTAEKILDLAETLIQTRGCSAFSYQDIAECARYQKGQHPLSFRIEDRPDHRGD